MEPADEQDAFKCPITTFRMRDPVSAADGHSYERESMERWINQCKSLNVLPTSPKTGAVLRHELLVPNHALRNAIEAIEPHQPPQRSPSPKPKRTKQTATSAVSLNQTGSSDLIHVTNLIQHAESLVDAGDVRGVLDALLPVGRLLSDPAVRASVLPDHLVTSLSRTGIEPIHDSLLCQQENRCYLVLLQALAVHELGFVFEPTRAGVISVLKIAVCTNIQ